MSEESRPNYLYKIISSSTPIPDIGNLPDALPVSDTDQASGFIFLSTAPQVPGTLQFFFKDEPRVYVLRIAYTRVEEQIKWEDFKGEVSVLPGEEGMFPHLYNDFKLGKGEVERVETLQKGEDGWNQTVYDASADWLIW